MKRLILGTLTMSFAAAASAQSSVTLYGLVDNGLQFETNLPAGHRWAAESGNWAESRFGLKGAEDIGGGRSLISSSNPGSTRRMGASRMVPSSRDRQPSE
jgi:predicted porin